MSRIALVLVDFKLMFVTFVFSITDLRPGRSLGGRREQCHRSENQSGEDNECFHGVPLGYRSGDLMGESCRLLAECLIKPA